MHVSRIVGLLPTPASMPLRRHLLVGALALTTLWAGSATYYLVFHDEVLARFVSQQTAMQYGYEEQIGSLRLQLDRAAMEQVVVRDGLARRMADLAARQAALETRHAVLSNLAGDTAGRMSPDVPATEPVAEVVPSPLPSAKPFPTPSPLQLRSADDTPERHSSRANQLKVIKARTVALDRRLDTLAEAQSRALAATGLKAGRGAQRLRGLVARLGLDPVRFERPREPGIGGPLVPLDADAFGSSLAQAQRALAEEAHLRRVTSALPLRRPLAGEISLSSTFGARLDPFTRGYALHTGIDMRAETGEPARATAAGRVTVAEYNGGYGNMVELDHGNGLATRYAHLSAYDVMLGQWVEAGAIVGRVGSTGRSTGSHLHYETRIDGEPVDPQRFLRATASLD